MVYLLEMALKNGIVALYPYTIVTFLFFRRFTIACVQLANIPL